MTSNRANMERSLLLSVASWFSFVVTVGLNVLNLRGFIGLKRSTDLSVKRSRINVSNASYPICIACRKSCWVCLSAINPELKLTSPSWGVLHGFIITSTVPFILTIAFSWSPIDFFDKSFGTRCSLSICTSLSHLSETAALSGWAKSHLWVAPKISNISSLNNFHESQIQYQHILVKSVIKLNPQNGSLFNKMN